jgi:asparagine synthase (glutamine-hydrolysing)
MSAIAGLLRLDGKDVSGADLQRMVAALISHGPDKQKIWSHQGLGLAHCLMCFTPEDHFEQQPITDKDNGIAMVFSGRLDNRSELAIKLKLEPEQGKLMSDSQLAYLAYLMWAENSFNQLIGDWVCAIWLRHNKQLLLVRDPQGYSRSLHYTKQPGFFAFSSAPKGLMALPEMPREMDQGALADFLILNHKNLSSTMYKDVLRLPPAHLLCFDLASRAITIKRYWHIDISHRITYKNYNDYVEHFNDLFSLSVNAQIRSCHPIGAFMSGGIDSSAVATNAAKQLAEQGKRLTTYTAVPQQGFTGQASWGRYNDETSLVNAIAKMNPNLQTKFIASEGHDQLSGLENHLEQGEAPFRNPCNRVWMENIMRTAASNGERVLLTGQKGNITMSAEGHWALAHWAINFKWIKLFWGIKQLHQYRDQDLLSVVKDRLVKPLLPSPIYRKLVDLYSKRIIGWSSNSLISKSFAQQIEVTSRAHEAGFDPYRQLPICSRKFRAFILAGNNYLGDIDEGWRASFGVELRDPTADRRIIEYCLAIPDEQYLNRKGLRWLATRAFKGQLPEAVLHNKLRGAQDPGWYLRMQQTKAELELEYQRLTQNATAQQVLDLPRMRKLLDEWPKDSANWNSKKILGLYRQGLSRGIMVGRYIRWFEGDNR